MKKKKHIHGHCSCVWHWLVWLVELHSVINTLSFPSATNIIKSAVFAFMCTVICSIAGDFWISLHAQTHYRRIFEHSSSRALLTACDLVTTAATLTSLKQCSIKAVMLFLMKKHLLYSTSMPETHLTNFQTAGSVIYVSWAKSDIADFPQSSDGTKAGCGK